MVGTSTERGGPTPQSMRWMTANTSGRNVPVVAVGTLSRVLAALGGAVILLSGATPLHAQIQACCDLTSVDRTCFNDEIGVGMVCEAPRTGLGKGTTCTGTDTCVCDAECNACAGKESGNLASFEFKLLDPVYDGSSTTFTYQVCQPSGSAHALSHFVLGLSELCCGLIEGTSGGSSTGACQADPTSGLYGLKFELPSSPPTCDGTCGTTGDLFSVVLTGNIATGCVKVANKADALEDISTACIKGPDCRQRGACCHGTTGICDDGLLEDDCVGDQDTWYKETPCSAITCEEHTGACCDYDTGSCTSNLTDGQCAALQPDPLQRDWFKQELCVADGGTITCPEHTGACCDYDTGSCTSHLTEAQCAALQPDPLQRDWF
ncbi:MAG: hypothetical protein JSU86_13060, partial [Phycisphaerales bacterium]